MQIQVVPLFLALLAAPLAAQTSPPSPADFANTNTISLSLSGTPTFKRVVSGTLIGDGAEHVVLLAGTQIVFLYEPSVSSSVHLLSGAATDLDVAPRVSSNPDGIATVSASGLRLYTFNGSSFVSSAVSESIDWLDARRVRADDINGTGVTDYVGVNSDGSKMVVRRDVSGVPTETSFSLTYEVRDMMLVQWDNDTSLEIAVLDSYGVHVFEYTGTVLESYPDAGHGEIAFAKFRVSSDARDRIAWLVDVGDGTQELRELCKRNPGQVVSIASMPYACVALAGGNGRCGAFSSPEQDGNWELVVMRTDSYSPLVLHNLGAADPDPNFVVEAPAPSPAHHGYLRGGTPALESIAGPSSKPILYDDLNGDGLPDLLAPIVVGPGQQVVAFWRGTVSSSDSPTVYSKADMPDASSAPDTRNLRVALTLPPPPAWSNCLEAILWRQDYDPAGAPRIGLGHWYYPLTELPTPPPGPQVQIPITANTGDPEVCFATTALPVVFWLELRYAHHILAANKIDRVAESFIAHLTSDMDAGEELISSEVMPGATHVLCLNSASACEGAGFCPLGPGDGTSLVRTPSLVSRSRIPPSIGNVPQSGPVSHADWYTGIIL